MSNFWPKKWSQSLTRELLKQYLTEKQNGCLRSGRLREVVAYEKWSNLAALSIFTVKLFFSGLRIRIIAEDNAHAEDAVTVRIVVTLKF